MSVIRTLAAVPTALGRQSTERVSWPKELGGHLARDGREHAIRLLDELSASEHPRWTLVDATLTRKTAAAASVGNESNG